LLGLSKHRSVGAQQVHGADVHTVSTSSFGKTIRNVDGLVFDQRSSRVPVALMVITADCVPMLFSDEKRQIIGAAHAGWAGTLSGIASVMIQAMVSLGARENDIVVALGPHIKQCCYDVSKGRSRRFSSIFEKSDVVASRGNQHFVDLGLANRLQLEGAGIQRPHIDENETCTQDNPEILYSYRRDHSRGTYGEQMAVIGVA